MAMVFWMGGIVNGTDPLNPILMEMVQSMGKTNYPDASDSLDTDGDGVETVSLMMITTEEQIQKKSLMEPTP